MARRTGLGKGLDSLISSEYKKNKDTEDTVKSTTKSDLSTEKTKKVDKNVDNSVNLTIKSSRMLKISEVEPNRDQPRKNFDEQAMNDLTDSIRQYGVLQPLLVKKVDKHYVIIAGERRWRAAKAAGLKEIPAIVKDYSDQEIMEISLIENIQRDDLNVIEEAKAYQRLIDEFHYRQEDLAEKLSRSRTAVTNRLRLLKLAEEVQTMLVDGVITEGHARAILSLEDKEQQTSAAKEVAEKHLSVRDTEKLVKKIQEPAQEKEDKDAWKKADQFLYDQWEEELKASMGTKVSIQRKKKDKGQITIDYYSVDELERLLDLLKAH